MAVEEASFRPVGVPPNVQATYDRMCAVLVQERIVEMHDAGKTKEEIAGAFGATWGVAGSAPTFQVINHVLGHNLAHRESLAAKADQA